MAQHNDNNEYNKCMPTPVPVPKVSGYPNDVKKTQTMQVRGTGAATKGTMYNAKGD